MTFEWATVGNVGNAADSTGFGAVNYEYRISKYEVTNTQYTAFLNAVDSGGSNALSLWDSGMESGAGGINFDSGAASGSKYSVRTGRGDQPVVYVSWNDAARFTNWLHNGQGTGSTESGVYDFNSFSQTWSTRSENAAYYLPTQDEWYKAAYYDGDTGTYYDYGHATDVRPLSGLPESVPAGANYYVGRFEPSQFGSGYAKTGNENVPDNPLTNVGEYAQAVSPYGLSDVNGNVREWSESEGAIDGDRVVRGGGWSQSYGFLQASNSQEILQSEEDDFTGFRVASIEPVPEPGSATLLIIGAVGSMRRRWR